MLGSARKPHCPVRRMSLRIDAGSVFDYPEQLQPLLKAHVAELTTDPDIMELAPQWDVYRALEETDRKSVV